jgi:hypothetical protein
MKKSSKVNEKRENAEKELIVAKIGFRNSIIIAIIGLIGTALTAYFGYLSNRTSQQDDITIPLSSPTTSSTSTPTNTPTIMPTKTLTVTSTPTNLSIFATLPVQIDHMTTGFPKDPTTENIIIYPSCNCNYDLRDLGINESSILIVRLRWGAKTADLAETGADSVLYSLSITQNDLFGSSGTKVYVNNIALYRRPAVFVKEPVLKGDPPELWWVYWDYPLQPHSSNFIGIEVTVNALAEINNGLSVIPAGYSENFTSTTLLAKPAFVD